MPGLSKKTPDAESQAGQGPRLNAALHEQSTCFYISCIITKRLVELAPVK